MAETSIASEFAVKDCAIAAIGTGRRAGDLREFRDQLLTAHPGCIYYHFWGAKLRPKFEDPEYLNDFASWVMKGLHDKKLAEKLGVIDPAEFGDMETLRQEVLDVVEERLDELDVVPWSEPDRQFHFVRSQVVVFDSSYQFTDPEELTDALPNLSLGSIFYHFIDARRRHPEGLDDIRSWLMGFDGEYQELIERIAEIDPYFASLREMRSELAQAFKSFFHRR